jgi:transcriptional regulator with XRE-family HTH domain
MGLSQQELAEMAGISRPALGALERGESAPRLKTLASLASALEVDPGTLFPEVADG